MNVISVIRLSLKRVIYLSIKEFIQVKSLVSVIFAQRLSAKEAWQNIKDCTQVKNLLVQVGAYKYTRNFIQGKSRMNVMFA